MAITKWNLEEELTSERMNQMADEMDNGLNEHKADNVTQVAGVHGLKIESGTFTPKLQGNVAVNNTYSVNTGTYYLVGKLCKFDIMITLTAKNASMAGGVSISGLPFVSKNVANKYNACQIGILGNVDFDATRNLLSVAIAPNSNYIILYNTGDNVSHLQANASIITNTTTIVISGEYEIL